MSQDTETDIRAVCNEIAEMLIEKNRSYGDSALNPVRIFSKEASPVEQINVRIDDKLSRLLKGNGNHFHEDVEKDLMGYLVLKRVAQRRVKPEDTVMTSMGPGKVLSSIDEGEENPTSLKRIDVRPSAKLKVGEHRES